MKNTGLEGVGKRRLAAFGTGLSIGFSFTLILALPLLFATSQAQDTAKPDDAVKSRGITITAPGVKASPAAAADADDFIEGNYWALIIGINKYPTMDKDKQLEAARKDAEAISKLLVDRYGFSKERMVELYDDAASRKGVIRAFSSLRRRLTDKDSLFIYYAGHGEYETSGKDKEKTEGMGYWIPSDAELDDPSSYVFNSQVKDYLANIPARHIYMVSDSCFSGSLMGKTRALGLSKSAIKELYQEKSRWVLASGGLYPVPDAADKGKKGHSTFAWHFMKILEKNTNTYLLAKDIIEPLAVRVSNEVQGQLPRSAPVVAAGDEGGQFVFRLRKELQPKGTGPDQADIVRLEAERAKVAQAQAELSGLEDQLKKAEEALKKQQEEMAARKQAMLARLKEAQEQAAREAAAEEQRLAAELKAAEEKVKREAEERQARLKAEEERVKKLEEERLAAAKKFEQEQKAREQRAREAELARQKLEEERKAEAERIAAQKREAEERARQAELARKKAEEERKAEEARLAELKRQQEEKERQRLAELKRQEEERKAEEARLAAELKKREELEQARIKEEQRKLAELRKKQEAEKESARLAELKRQEEEARQAELARRKAEEERIAELKRQAEERERQRLAELKRQEEERKAEEARLAELKRQEEEKERQRLAELKRQEEERKAEERRLAELKKQEEERERQHVAELKRQEEERKRLEAEMKAAQEREQKRLAELKRQQEEQERKAAEEQRIAEEKRLAEEKRVAEEKAKAEAARLAALKRQEEAARKAEEERLAALAREAEEQKRKLEEAKKKAEEEQKALLARQKAAEEQAARQAAKGPAIVEGTGAGVIVEATLRPYLAPKAKDLSPVVTISAGHFIMGSKPGDGQPDEGPQRKVYLDAYTIDKYEVTVAQYADYLKKSGAEPPDFWERVKINEDGNRPVVGVDWLEANEYCEYYGKRLPTEAQWEKAARGEDGRKYPWGSDEPGPLFANYASGVSFSYGKSLAPVGNYESGKSPYGVYDMVGNVWEWTLDWYDKNYYQGASLKNPTGPASGDHKVIRGGSWSKRPAIARVAGRMALSPSQRSNSLGFRCVGEAR